MLTVWAASSSLIGVLAPSRSSFKCALAPSCQRIPPAFPLESDSVMRDHRCRPGGGQRDWGMTPAAIGFVIVFMIVGLVTGWHGQKTVAAHADVKVAKNRLRGGRKTRWRSA